MAIKTTAEQLEEVQTAITALLSGVKSYSIDGGISVTRENLSDLQAREDILRARYNRENGTRPRVSVGQFGVAAADE